MTNRRILTATLILVLASLSSACGGRSAEQKAVANDALKALRKLDAAMQTGLSSRVAFQTLIIEAQAQVNEANSKLPEGELRQELNEAMQAYLDLQDILDLDQKSKSLLTLTEPGATLIPKYSLKTVKVGNDGFAIAQYAIPIVVSAASEHVNRASKLLGN